jgi:uncharacterized protein YeaO (DUF488 family)
VKRVYEPSTADDGLRILVDRLWPRGVRKEDAHVDEWRKELAPSTELRTFYGHRPERFDEFTQRYRAELGEPERADAIDAVLRMARRRRVTLVTATRDVEHSGAAVLGAFLGDAAVRRR